MMTPPQIARELLAQLAQPHTTQTVDLPVWVRDELTDTWHAARREAGAAYLYWSELRTSESYTVYRAAQDREDAAQDALAFWAANNRSATAG